MRPLLILLLCAPAWGQIAPVASTSVANPSNLATTTTSAIDTTGATLLVIGLSNYTTGGNCSYGVADSKSNGWTCAGTYHAPGMAANATLWYSIPTSVGTGHTFTTYGAYMSFAVTAFSGTASSLVLDAITGGGQDTGATLQPGTLTPAGNGELLITVGGTYQSIDISGVDSPFSSNYAQHVASSNGTNNSVGLAYEIQATATARNPTWALSPTTNASAALIAAFKPYVAPAAPTLSGYTLSAGSPWPSVPFNASIIGTTFIAPVGVNFCPTGGGACTAASSVTVNSSTLLTVNSQSLTAGSWKMDVTAAGGTSGYSSPFTVAPMTVAAHTPHFPHLSTAIVDYGQYTTPPGLWSTINTWLGSRFDWVLGGGGTGDAHGGNLTKTYYSTYKDMPDFTAEVGYLAQDTAITNGFVLENMYLHANVDSALTAYTSDMTRFDAFEPYLGGGNYDGGVFTYSSGAYADVTNGSWFGSPTTTVASTLYVGYQEPFDQMNFAITTARTGGTVAYNYWNGSAWTALSSHLSDGTSGLTTSGKVYWYPPSDWAQKTLTVNVTTPFPITTTHLKYWVQIVVSGASVSPIYSTVKGDDWAVSSAGNTFRGWNATDANRINVGTRLEYNPTPPGTASAKFQYQARATAGGNNMYGNPSDVQSGIRTWGRALADIVDSALNPTDNYDAVFYDDATNLPSNADASLDYNHTEGWLPAWGALHTELIARLKSEHGSNFWVTNNGQTLLLGGYPIGDANLLETAIMPGNYYSAAATRNPFPDYTFGGACCVNYDDFLTANNPNNVKVYTAFYDTSSLNAASSWSPGNGSMATWHFVDRANRTPMLTLAMHYMGTNSNTGYMYHGGQEIVGYYLVTDQVDTYDTPTTLASPIPADTSSGAKAISLMSVDTCVGSVFEANGIVMQLGPSGDVVKASAPGYVRVLGGDVSLQAWGGSPTMLLGSYPTATIQAGYSTPFSHLSFGVVDPSGGAYLTWTYWNGSAQVALTVADGTNVLHNSGTITFTPPGDWATTSIGGVTAYWITGTLDTTGHQPTVSTIRSSDWKIFSTTSPIYNSYLAGAAASCIQSQHLAAITSPSVANVWGWTTWFPAMGVDLGVPNTAGYRAGVRAADETGGTPWLYGSAISGHSPLGDCSTGGCPNVWRRDFTNGIVLMRPFRGSLHLEAELDTPSQAIALGGTYQLLSADGTLGAPVTSVSLRAGEAAILMGVSGVVTYRPVFGSGTVTR